VKDHFCIFLTASEIETLAGKRSYRGFVCFYDTRILSLARVCVSIRNDLPSVTELTPLMSGIKERLSILVFIKRKMTIDFNTECCVCIGSPSR